MGIKSFEFSGVPDIVFGAGTFEKIDQYILKYGKRVLIVTGGASFRASGKYDRFVKKLEEQSIQVFSAAVSGEPSPELIDEIVNIYRDERIDVIAAIGGGSVVDAGKAISAMLPLSDSVMNYIEGVGTGKEHTGEKVPFIAVPTTAGTGSEATKNAVLSRVGAEGFKNSLRHDHFIPNVALVDPILVLSCPASITAASGLDAFSQLIEAYVSSSASPMTDALAFDGLKYIVKNLIPACTTGAKEVDVRSGMAYASLMSGIVLANAGLGIVHGLAGPIGGFFNIPHGATCGTLLAEMVKINIDLLRQTEGQENIFLKKYARVGALFMGHDENDIDECCNMLVQKLEEWIVQLNIPTLSQYGVSEKDIDKIVEKGSNKNNPVKLNKYQIRQLLMNRL
ncbi:iron-containing alcohol dehydrogenase [Petroclostridium sp. X23]|uniref:iron-containing alcohol dehydrogenase n=1 Tax=Petroclostridium sp. X23 TaxID=3045146 RepID=UPI0024AD3D09|nr:iron-containing alcohol dehydrogenase [Petroclostridium sp. X23]WHH60867.1 iron-containing alcohol dehydrogenase [Petroclostridium sp. X23]